MFRFFILLMIFLISSASSYLWASRTKPSSTMTEAELSEELKDDPDRPLHHSLPYAIAAIDETRENEGGLPADRLSVVQAALESSQLSPKEKRLKDILGENLGSQSIFHALIASHHTHDVPGAQQYMDVLSSELQGDPERGLQLIQRALVQIPRDPEFAVERAALLSQMSSLPGKGQETKSHALAELTQSIVPARPDTQTAHTDLDMNPAFSTTHEMNLVITAQNLFLQNATNHEEALQGTVQGIIAQQDLGLRLNLAHQFINKYPSLHVSLTDQLRNHGITLPSGETK